MKSSNLAVRLEFEEKLEDGAAPRAEPAAVELERQAAARRMRVRKSFEYRAIVIRDPGLRGFRVG